MRRRQLLGLTASVGLAGMAGCTVQTGSESPRREGSAVSLEPVVTDLDFPTAMAFLPDDSRLITERDGRVVRHADGESDLVLDIREDMAPLRGERGMLGLELHPAFPDTPLLYLRYSAPARSGDYSHIATLSEFQLDVDGSHVDRDSERRILEIPQPGEVHNAGDLAFGPDGYLYVPLGDGQMIDFDDEGWSWWYDRGQSAQETESNLLGGILRIDVDNPDDNRPYGIPPDNPMVNGPGRTEYFAWGLRNPYRISFDDGDLYVADVGAHTREMVYVVEAGDNFGWPILEGSTCSPTTQVGPMLEETPWNVFNPKAWLAQINRLSPDKICPTPSDRDAAYVDPVIEYFRPGARAITGGYVYRGAAIPSLEGQYVFGDLLTPAPIYAADPEATDSRPWPISELHVQNGENGRLGGDIVSFGRDLTGEIYVLTTEYAEETGRIDRISPPAE